MATEEAIPTTGQPRVEFLIGLAYKELADVTKALERNWIVHLILAGIGIALVFDVGDLPKFLSKYMSQDTYDLKPAAAIILAVLLYYFARFGQLLSAFVESRQPHVRDVPVPRLHRGAMNGLESTWASSCKPAGSSRCVKRRAISRATTPPMPSVDGDVR
jgi:hypothetical protein